MKSKTIKPTHLEDLSEYLVEVKTKRPNHYLEHMSALNECEYRYHEGDLLAVHDAILHCERGGLPMPLWLSHTVRNFVLASLTGGFRGKKGRANSPLGKQVKKLKQEVHYRLVMQIQRIAVLLMGERIVATIAGERDLRHVFPTKIYELIQDKSNDLKIEDFRNSLESAYSAASKILRGTFAQAEPRTIRLSFKKLQKRYNDKSMTKHISWFADADPETLDALGLEIEMSEAEMSAFVMGQDFVEPEPEIPPLFREE